MIGGDGFGVGLTVAPLDLLPSREGVRSRPSRLTEVLPPAGRSRDGVALELRRLQALEARLAAYKASLVVQLADTHDHAAEIDVPEFFVDELALTLGTSMTAAGATWTSSETLVRRLPGTWAALADGELDQARGRAIAAERDALPHTERCSSSPWRRLGVRR